MRNSLYNVKTNYMKKSLFTSFFAALLMHCYTQEFQTVFGSDGIDIATSIVQFADQSYLVAGYTDGTQNTGTQMYLARLDAMGDTLWTKSMGGFGLDTFEDLALKEDGNVLFTGVSNSLLPSNGNQMIVGELRENGEILWTREIGSDGDDQGRSIYPTADGGYIASGISNSSGLDYSYDMIVVKGFADGSVDWYRSLGTPGYEAALYALESLEGDIFVYGHCNTDNTQGYDLNICKLSASGTFTWSKTLGAFDNELAWDMTLLPDGDILFCGDTNSNDDGLNDGFLIRMQTNGQILWSKTYGMQFSDHFTSVQYLDNDMIAIAGLTASIGNGGLDVMAMFINTEGYLKYAHSYGGENKDMAIDVTKTFDGGLALIGNTRSWGQGFNSCYLVKTNIDGNAACNQNTSDQFIVKNFDIAVTENQFMVRTEAGNISTVDFILTSKSGSLVDLLCREGHVDPQFNPNIGNNNSDDDTADDETLGLEFYGNSSGDVQFKLFPNPSTGFVQATIEKDNRQEGKIRVTNLTGVLKWEKDIGQGSTAQIDMDLSFLSSGVYFVQLEFDNKLLTQRLILQ